MRVRRTTSIPANGHCFSSRCVEHLVADSLLAMPGQSPVFLVMVTSSSHPRAEASCALDGSSFATLAQETRKRILRLHRGAGDQAQWKWIENARNFSIYTKQVDGYGVQSSGVIKGCVQEVISLLSSSSQEEFQRKMSAVHGQDFKHGEYVADVAVDSESGEGRGSALSVRRATFARRGWFSRDDEWCYLDETNYSSPRFEKYMTTLSTHDAFISSLHAPTKRDKAVQFRDAVAGFFIQPEDTDRSAGERNCGACVRVHFYAELTSVPRAFLPTFSVPTSKRQAPVSAIQSRLLQIARDCDRLALLVRRRRLGVQVLVNRRSVIPAINGVCIKCERTLVIGKQCRVCGQSVCSDCSEKYERETRVRTRSGEPVHRLEMVRVCDPCLARVESADYAHFNDDARAGSAVVPDPVRKDDISNSAAVDLKALLQDALLNAPSPQRKTAVLSVIRQVLDQEAQDQGDLTPISRARETKPFCKVTDASVAYATDDETINALDNLALRVIPHDEAPIADIIVVKSHDTTFF